MAVYKDINLSLENTLSNDFPVLNDADSIKNTLYNNLLVSPAERYFNDDNIMDITSLIHNPNDGFMRAQIGDAIFEAANLDERIRTINSINVRNPNGEYNLIVDINAFLNITIEGQDEIDITLIFDKG